MSDTTLLSAINERISELFGIYYVPSQWGNMMRVLIEAAREAGSGESLEDIHNWIVNTHLSEKDIHILSYYVTIGETYFFREQAGFDLLARKIIPDHLADHMNNGKIRIWSAGCSTGEEPYSIAMTIMEQFPDLQPHHVGILATDVNIKALEKARKGTYTPWSFRQTSDEIRNRYFRSSDKKYMINPDIKQMVQFAHMNLVFEAACPRAIEANSIDVIFCRNLLMYMSPEKIHRVVNFLYQSLKMDGWLITSQVELNDTYFGAFQRVLFENGIFYRKVPQQASKKTIVGFSTHTLKETAEEPVCRHDKPTKPARKLHPEARLALPVTQTPHRQVVQLSDADRLFQRAIRSFQAYRYTECASICEQFIRKNGLSSEFVLLLARTYANSGDLHKAAEVMEKWLSIGTGQASHYHLYATILSEMGQLDKANQVLVKALYLDSGYLPAILSRSQVLKQLGKHEMARKEITNLDVAIRGFRDDHAIPELEGMTAGRIREMVAFLSKE